LNYFIKGGDTTAFGVTQAITYFAQMDATPEERFDLETSSVEVLEKIVEFDKAELKVNPIQSKMSLN